MSIELTTRVVYCEGGRSEILLETESYVDHTHGKHTTIAGRDCVIVGHTNFATFASYAFTREIRVVSPQFWIPVENPAPGDKAVIGYWRWGKDLYDRYIGIYVNPTLRNPLRYEDARLDGVENKNKSFRAILPGCVNCGHFRIEPDDSNDGVERMLARCAACTNPTGKDAPFITRRQEYNTILAKCYKTPSWCPLCVPQDIR